ncbi:AAA family ATPase [Micromonospora sp. WMMD1082]|uniref:AAA family ATPase n=1 Tax=Micromonospora sp. WMMD1082 TaxID=3016104 RepID=UPI0024171ACE|nr:AAA family ATPase [Micromonospora sp. WMMD1082]MDG4796971.1 AAA family ATPase [Micromonospora sp. WMMD1082]
MPATRKKAKARIALAGPSGAGKTLTGLKLLYTLTGAVTITDGIERIAFVDTERDSADKYAVNPELPGVGGMTPEEAGGYGFSKISPVRYDPRQLIELIDEAALVGFGGLIIDSLSHYWFGPGGVLEMVDLAARNHGGRSMDGWREVRPFERAYIEALMSFPGHVVVCLRSKQRYELVEGTDGKAKVAKLGMQPDQREGIEFEFDVVGDIDAEHYLRVTKSRCDALADRVIHKPGAELGHQLLDWLDYGEPTRDVDWPKALAACTSREDLAVLWQRAQRLGKTQRLRDAFNARGAEIAAARRAAGVPGTQLASAVTEAAGAHAADPDTSESAAAQQARDAGRMAETARAGR